MSAICGVWLRMEAAETPSMPLGPMMNALSHAGPDAAEQWADAEIALGQRMLWTTPESLQEKLPFQQDNLVITADARIDNRAELCAALDCPSTVSDSQLILSAYRQWGTDCPRQLLGDFAFAIWDQRAGRLFCARDHWGVRPFYYTTSAARFAFATEIKALLTLPNLPRTLNEARIAHFLMGGLYVDQTSTFFTQVVRLPAAHWLLVTRDNFRMERYWAPDPTRSIHFASDLAYAEAFREIFAEAVRCRLRSAYPLGFELSGGLDSSSVVSMARALLPPETPMHAFHLQAPVPERDESAYARAVVRGKAIEYHTMTDPLPFAGFEAMMGYLSQPIELNNPGMVWGMYRAMHEANVRVVLDGDDGDTMVSHGRGFLYELAHGGAWARLGREAVALAARRKVPLIGHLGFAYPRMNQLFWRLRWPELARAVNILHQTTGVSVPRLLGDAIIQYSIPPWAVRWVRSRRGLQGLTVQSALATRHPMLHPSTRSFKTEREDHLEQLTPAPHQAALEEVAHLSSPHQLEMRHPFRDIRLVEFCLALPGEQKLGDGWMRLIVRRALEGILPPEVQWRGDKMNFQASNAYNFVVAERDFLRRIFAAMPSTAAQYIDPAKVRAILDALDATTDFKRDARSIEPLILALWQTANFVEWLNHVTP